jgi:hypothetical protein
MCEDKNGCFLNEPNKLVDFFLSVWFDIVQVMFQCLKKAVCLFF